MNRERDLRGAGSTIELVPPPPPPQICLEWLRPDIEDSHSSPILTFRPKSSGHPGPQKLILKVRGRCGWRRG